jgi:hypothetical protein
LAGCSDPGPIGGVPDAFAPGDGSSTRSFLLEAGKYEAAAATRDAALVTAFTGAGAYVAFTGTLPTNLGDAGHFVGASCGPCHSTGCGSGIPCFTLGGTVYKDYAGTVPAPGVEVRVVDLHGKVASTYSGSSGNFALYADAGVTLPAMVGARDSTSTRPMVTTLAVGMCATAGCHVVGAGLPDSGGYFPIHVP